MVSYTNVKRVIETPTKVCRGGLENGDIRLLCSHAISCFPKHTLPFSISNSIEARREVLYFFVLHFGTSATYSAGSSRHASAWLLVGRKTTARTIVMKKTTDLLQKVKYWMKEEQ